MKRLKNQKGQALITLIFFMVIAVIVITAAVSVIFINSLSTNSSEQGLLAYYAAESGAEDGILRLLRSPTYSGTYQPFPAGTIQATVTITNGNPTTIVSQGISDNNVRKIQIQTVYNNGAFTISSWKEIN